MINITEAAQEYLAELLAKQDVKDIAVRIFILDAGTPRAETCISFCRPGEEKADDEVKLFGSIKAFIEHKVEYPSLKMRSSITKKTQWVDNSL